MKYISIVLIALLFVAAKPAPRPQTKQQLIVVEEAQLSAANAAAVTVGGPRAANTFAIKYEGADKKGYYVCSWRMTPTQAAKFAALMTEQVKNKKLAIYKEAKGKTADEAKFSGSAAEKLAELKMKPSQSDPVKPKDEKEK